MGCLGCVFSFFSVFVLGISAFLVQSPVFHSLLKLSFLPTLSQATNIGRMLLSVVWAMYRLIVCNCILYSVGLGNWEMKLGANIVELFYNRVVVFGNLCPFLLFI